MRDLAHLDGLIDLLVEALVREIESPHENGPAMLVTKRRAVKDETCNSIHEGSAATVVAAQPAASTSTASACSTGTE
jgi:hypothetical protein